MATLPNGIPIPDVPINFVPAKAGEVIKLGQLTCRIMEDGSNTGESMMYRRIMHTLRAAYTAY